jgi:hypothetical protein
VHNRNEGKYSSVTTLTFKISILQSPADYALADYRLLWFKVNVTQIMTVLEVDKPNGIVYEMSGGFPGKWTYTLKAEGNGIRLNTEVSYTVRGCVLGEIANRLFIQRMHQRKTKQFATGLKVFCES